MRTGLPHPEAEEKYGGRAGQCSPPHPLMGAILRQLLLTTADAGLEKEFEVTFETTHHGPWLAAPVCFCEIGSTDTQWGRTDAAACYADVLCQVLKLGGLVTNVSASNDARAWCTLSEQERADAVVFISLGKICRNFTLILYSVNLFVV